MRQHDDVVKRSGLGCARWLESPRSWSRFISPALITLLALSTLACAFLGANSRSVSKPVIIRVRLPTLTPTSLLTMTPPALATPMAVAVAPQPTETIVTQNIPPPPSTIPLATEVVSAVPAPAPSHSANLDQDSPAEPVASSVPLPSPTPLTTAPPAPTLPPMTTSIVIPTATPIPETPGWSFASVRTYADEYEGGLLLYGDMINNTGAAQKVAFITGAFYDAQGQLIAGQDSTIEHWPVDVIPPGGRVPFELAVNGIQATANYKLWANSEATGQTPHQDFNFSEVEQWQEEDVYCLTGQLQNPAGELQEYLVIVATLYDGQGNVVNFSDRYESNPQAVVDGDTLEFEICVDPPYQDVARYELRAWGE